MLPINKIKKALTGGEWYVAHRKKGEKEFSIAEVPEGQWCADPFVYEVDGEHYIFVEQYKIDKDKGCIGYYRIDNGIPVNKGIIIENSYHMSYPDVFEYNGNHYMIPESSANNTVDLYVADSFPEKWRKIKTLIDGEKLVDSTVYQEGRKYYIITYSMINGYEVRVYKLDMGLMSVTQLSSKRYSRNVGRPGGRLFWENSKLLRPAQDCSKKYGEALILDEVDQIDQNGEYIEHEVRRIDLNSIVLNKQFERVHQLTDDGMYTVIDVFKEKMDLLHGVKILRRTYLRK